ncbi:Beta-D-xylosidase 1 [Fasciola gigantica]|uniref:Beta-D-xylosidase 1 n=1 Tax=Fasciola gigantica TaxID=46835 RepID=A0A504YSZ9_FASGI|nr:Beta-D-xylosidase 1 [Fasciola gigantica]
MEHTWLFSFLSAIGLLVIHVNQNDRVLFRDPTLPISMRLDDLLSRLTTEELIEQVSKGGAGPKNSPAPAIPRLAIAPFQWRSNPGDGLGTSFPLPINQAATFDKTTVMKVALAMGLENRAKWNYFRKQGIFEDGIGVNLFAPVTNLMRHPLWGRNQETYGEDPYLAGELARAFVRGLGGWTSMEDDLELTHKNPLLTHKILVGATCKHFAGHTGPEDYPTSRLSFEANITESDMWLTYLPAFRECMKAGAIGVMCAYSGINGVPDCINKWLLNDILREKWDFPGFVVSDCGALQFVLSEHHLFQNNATTVAIAAVQAGVNLENSVSYLPYIFAELPALLRTGALNRDDLIRMAKPLFRARFHLGEFDPFEMDPYRELEPLMFVQSPAHRQLAMVSVARSTVLLHHRDQFLPIRSNPRAKSKPLNRILVIGPFATEVEELYGLYRNVRQPEFEISIAEGLEYIATRVDKAKICEDGGRCSNYTERQLDELFQPDDIQLVIITVGTGNRVEAEGMDRRNMSLPGHQKEFLFHGLDLAAGRGVVIRSPIPVVILVFSTGPVDIQTALDDENVKAIFWCGFPGASIGRAIAHLLLGSPGQQNLPTEPLQWEDSIFGSSFVRQGVWWIPAARLPFTWYASIDQLANITDYAMTNQTYRYVPHNDCTSSTENCSIPLLFPFGYGLTYNQIAPGESGIVYSKLTEPNRASSSGLPILITALVANRGVISCEEVVQFYISWMKLTLRNKTKSDEGDKFKHPPHSTDRFDRIALAVGARGDCVQF